MEQKLLKKPIIIGYLISFGIQFLVGIIFGFLVTLVVGLEGKPFEQIAQGMVMMGVGIILGFLSLTCGGYYAGKKAGFRHVDHGGWVGGVSLIISIVGIGIAMVLLPLVGFSKEMLPQTQLLIQGISLALTIPAGMLGGYLAGERSKETIAPLPTVQATETSVPPQV